MAGDRPTRVAVDLFDSAAEEGRRESRSAKQQLDHWARVGRSVSMHQTAARRRVEAALAGELPLADLGIAAGRKRGHLFIKGKIVRVVPEDEMVSALVEEAERLVAEGVEARLAAADVGAEAEAEADRRELLDAKGDDANASETKVELIRKRFGDEDGPVG